MPCSDPRYQQSLADAALGKLSAGELFQLHSHLQECPECRETFKAAAILAGKDAEVLSRELEGHLSNELLMEYYSNRSELSQSQLHSITAHLEQCVLCRDELQMLEGAEEQLRIAAQTRQRALDRDKRPWGRVRSVVLHPVMSAAMLIIIAMQAFLILRSPENAPSPGLPAIPEAIILREASRSSGNMQVISFTDSENFLHLGIPYPHVQDGHEYTVRLRHRTEPKSLPVSIWLRHEEAGKFDVLIEATQLQSGQYLLELLDVGHEIPGDTLATPFAFELKTK